MVRAGSLTRAAGTVAHSKPSIAHKVSAAAAEMPFALTGTGASSAGSPWPKTISAITIAATNGMIFNMLVRIWTLPEVLAPVQATAVNSATKEMAVNAETPGAAKNPGASELK